MSQMENAPPKIDIARMMAAIIERFCASWATPPATITLDIEDTLDRVHGHQQLSLFSAPIRRKLLPIDPHVRGAKRQAQERRHLGHRARDGRLHLSHRCDLPAADRAGVTDERKGATAGEINSLPQSRCASPGAEAGGAILDAILRPDVPTPGLRPRQAQDEYTVLRYATRASESEQPSSLHLCPSRTPPDPPEPLLRSNTDCRPP